MNIARTSIITVLAISLIGWSLVVVPVLAKPGGTVTGRLTFSGKIPPPKEFVFAKFPNPNPCAKNPNKTANGKVRLLKQVQVAEGGGLQDTIVAVRDLTDDAWMKSYKLVAWHPKAGLLERDIEVTDGGTVKIEFDLEGS